MSTELRENAQSLTFAALVVALLAGMWVQPGRPAVESFAVLLIAGLMAAVAAGRDATGWQRLVAPCVAAFAWGFVLREGHLALAGMGATLLLFAVTSAGRRQRGRPDQSSQLQ